MYLRTAEMAIKYGDYCSSVSRSYYAIFNVARALLLEKEISPKTHKGVHVKFAEEYIKTGIFSQQYNTILARGWRLREKGDYGVSINSISKADAEEMLRNAKEFLREAEKYLETQEQKMKKKSRGLEI